MFKPHVTVACVVHAGINFSSSKRPLTAKRCGTSRRAISRPMKRCCRPPNVNCGRRPAFAPRRSTSSACISGWLPITPRFCASCSLSNLAICAPLNRTTAISIAACGSVLRKFLTRQTCARRWLPKAFAALQDPRQPLSLIGAFNWPFTGVNER